MNSKATNVVALIILTASFFLTKVIYGAVTFTAQVGDTVLILSGYTAPQSLVTFSEDQAVIGTTSSDDSGRFTKEFTAQNPGTHNISISSTDPRNRSTPSINREIMLIGLETTDIDDLLLAPTINVNVSGTNSNSFVDVSGFAKPGTHLLITINSSSTKLIPLDSDSTGFYQYSLSTSDLEVGQHTVNVEIVDDNNVPLAQSFELTFIITSEMHGGTGQPVTGPTSSPVVTPTSSPQPVNPTPQPIINPPATVEQPTSTQQFINDVKQTAVNVLPPTLATASVGLLAINLISTPSSISIFYGFFIFRFRKKKISRGIVYDSQVKSPVPFTVIRLFSDSGKYLKQTVSDLNGKFEFIVDKGKYKIEAKQSGYSTFTDTIEMEQNEGTIADNIPLETNASLKITFGDKLKTILRDNLIKLNTVLVVVGFVFSIFAIVVSFTLLNVIILALYTFQFIVLVLSRRVNRSWGYIYNKKTNERISGAFIRVLDLKEKRQIDVQITDTKGRFGFDLDPGEYFLTIDAPGFKLEESDGVETTASGVKLFKFTILKKDSINLKLAMIASSDLAISSKFGMRVT